MLKKFIKGFVQKMNDDRKSVTVVASTGAVDRDGERINPKGWDFSNFQKNPQLLWAHDAYRLPIGKVTNIASQGDQVIADVEFAEQESDFAAEVARMVRGGYINAVSVGFIPKEMDQQGNIMSQELLELSFVNIPSNQEALVLSRAFKSFKATEERELERYLKTVVTYDPTTMADEALAWDGTAAEQSVRKWASSDGSGDPTTVDWKKYAMAFAWYDGANAETFNAYKLPHHQVIDGKLNVVWRGVAAAMTALLGGRGGTSIPTTEQDGVYNHLAKHYKQFGKEAPTKSFDEKKSADDALPVTDEINTHLSAVQQIMASLKEAIGKQDEAAVTELLNQIQSHMTQVAELMQNMSDMMTGKSLKDFKNAIEKVGRTISEKNRNTIRLMIDACAQASETGQKLLQDTEPPAQEGDKNKRQSGKTVESSTLRGLRIADRAVELLIQTEKERLSAKKNGGDTI